MTRRTRGTRRASFALCGDLKRRLHLLQNRANLRHVQEILGHRSLAMTERYLHLTITELKEAHRRFHPREKDVAG